MKYYPALLDVREKKAVIVGGGRVAERKARMLLRAGARVTVVSPDATGGIRMLGEKGLITLRQRKYRAGDLRNAFIAVAATSSAETNRKIAREAGFLVNVADTPSEGNFIVPSVVQQGPLTVAVSTGGASPAMSKAVRKEIEGSYGREFAQYLRLAEEARQQAMEAIPDRRKRRAFLKLLASHRMIATLRSGGFIAVKKKVMSALAAGAGG